MRPRVDAQELPPHITKSIIAPPPPSPRARARAQDALRTELRAPPQRARGGRRVPVFSGPQSFFARVRYTLGFFFSFLFVFIVRFYISLPHCTQLPVCLCSHRARIHTENRARWRPRPPRNEQIINGPARTVSVWARPAVAKDALRENINPLAIATFLF